MTKEQVSLTSLFVPGEGSTPPFLAGREPELAEIMAVADRLGYSDPEIQIPPSNIVVFGPRGNGKTVLLQEAVKRIRAHVEESGKSLQVALLTAKMISSKEELRQALAPSGGWKKFWQRLKNTRQIEISSLKVMIEEAEQPLLADLLAARVTDGPLLVTVDEAHELDRTVGGILLDLMQNARTAGLPVLLMMAGTPALQDHLNRMQVSFWDRCLMLPLDRLDLASAADALEKPLSERGISFEPEALQTVVRKSNGYPYFLQVWGQAICWALMESSGKDEPLPSHVNVDHVACAAPRAERRVRQYCGNRYQELRKARLPEAAVAVSGLYERIQENGRPERAYDTELIETIKGALGDEDETEQLVDRAFDQFKRLGFVWEAGDSFEPGIPSLMDYIANRYEAGRAATRASMDDEVLFWSTEERVLRA